MIEHAGKVTSPLSAMLFAQLGGQVNRVPEGHSATGPRDASFILNIQSSWLDAAESETHVAWRASSGRRCTPIPPVAPT